MGSLAHLKQRAMFGRASVVAVLIFVIKIPVVFTHSARGCKLCFLPFNPVFPPCFCFPSTLPCCLAKCLGHPAGRSQWSVFTFRVGSHSVSPSPGEHQTAMWNGLAFSRAWGKQKSKTKQKRKNIREAKSASANVVCANTLMIRGKYASAQATQVGLVVCCCPNILVIKADNIQRHLCLVPSDLQCMTRQ